MKLKEKKININLTTLIITCGLFILLFGGGLNYHINKIKEKNSTIQEEVKLRNALTADIIKHQNKEREWVSEKKTLQTSLDKLGGLYDNLNETQKELYKRMKNVEKNQTTIAAGLIDIDLTISNLIHNGDVDIDENHNTILFTDKKDFFEYKFLIGEVIKANPLIKPTLNIQTLKFPNRQEVKFYWENDKKEGYPVSFSIINSNPYIEIINMESYTIPEINKVDINPTKWESFLKWGNKNKKSIYTIGGATVIGVGLGLILSN